MVKWFLGLGRCFSNSKHHRWCENQLNPPEINGLQPLQKHRHLAQNIRDQNHIHSKNYLYRTPCRALPPSLHSYLPQLLLPLENSTSSARPGIQLAATRWAPNRTATPQEGTWTCQVQQPAEGAAAPRSQRAGAGRGPGPSSALPRPAGLRRQDQLPPCVRQQAELGGGPAPSWSDSPQRQGGLALDGLSSSAVK